MTPVNSNLFPGSNNFINNQDFSFSDDSVNSSSIEEEAEFSQTEDQVNGSFFDEEVGSLQVVDPVNVSFSIEEETNFSLNSKGEISVIKLNSPFGDQKVIQFDFSEQDVFTQMTFKDLLKDHRERGLPYFFAVTQDQGSSLGFFDGFSLFYDRVICNRTLSPLTRKPILKGMIYKLELNSDSPLEFCPLSSFTNNHPDYVFYVKSILVTSPNMTPDKRGELCYYLGGFYEHSNFDLDKAEFWYRKAVENQYFGAHLTFAGWFKEGKRFQQSHDKCLEELQEALKLSPPKHVLTISHLIEEEINSGGTH